MAEDTSERRVDLQEISKNMALLAQEIKSNTEITVKVHDRVFGNGNQGLIAAMAVMESGYKNIWKVLIAACPTVIALMIGIASVMK